MNPSEIFQLAKTFSTACKEAVAESKVETSIAPIVTAAVAVLTIKNVVQFGPPWV